MVYALQITSLFLHWYPACVVWTERWHPDVHSRENTSKTPEALRKWHEASFLEIALLPMVPYLVWAVLYYIKVSTAHPVPLSQRLAGCVLLSYPTVPRWKMCCLTCTSSTGRMSGLVDAFFLPICSRMLCCCAEVEVPFC